MDAVASPRVFDVGATLLGAPPSHPPPFAALPGSIILQIPEGLTLDVLRTSKVGKAMMRDRYLFERLSPDSQFPYPQGNYAMRLPVTKSWNRTFTQQLQLLVEWEEVAPAVLVVAALLCLQVQERRDPLHGRWTRCFEPTAPGRHAAVAILEHKLIVYESVDNAHRIDTSLSSLYRLP